MYDQGLATPIDPVQAFQWFMKGAENGNADAQNAVGVDYAKGRGTNRDVAAARVWLEKAQENGNAAAARNLRALR
jgi:TPR repeat protein